MEIGLSVVRSGAGHLRVEVVARLRGDALVLGLDHPQHRTRERVDVRDHAVDRMRPRQVGLVLLPEREHPEHPPALLVLVVEHAGGQRAGADLRHVGGAATGDRREPPVVGLHEPVDQFELLVEHGRGALGPRVELPEVHDGAVGDVGHRLGDGAGRDVQQERLHVAVELRGPLGVEHIPLVRLAQHDVGEAGGVGDQPRPRQDLACPLDLGAGQRRERVGRRGGDRQRHGTTPSWVQVLPACSFILTLASKTTFGNTRYPPAPLAG